MQHFGGAPSPTLVETCADGHAVASGIRRVGKEYRISVRVSEYTRLAARVNERRIFSHIAPRLATVAAKRNPSIVRAFGLIYPSMVPDAEQPRAISQLDHLTLARGIVRHAGAELPCFAVVVAVEDVGMVIPASGNAVIARNNQSSLVVAVLQLDAAPRTGGIPRPVRRLRPRRDFNRRRPRCARILTSDCPNGSGTLAHPFPDFHLVVFNQVMACQKPDNASLPIDHGAGVATGVGTVIPYNLHVAPGGAAISAAL